MCPRDQGRPQEIHLWFEDVFMISAHEGCFEFFLIWLCIKILFNCKKSNQVVC